MITEMSIQRLLGFLSPRNRPAGNGNGDGEPAWLPSPQAVARARMNLERRGVLRHLVRGPLPASLPPPQPAIPSLWWLAAGLWVALWPALIVLALDGMMPAWLPWWLPLPLAALHMGLLAYPALHKGRNRDKTEIQRRFGLVQTLPQIMALEPAEFEVWAGMLFQLMGYGVLNTADVADHGIDLVVTSARIERGLVQCKRYRGTVGEPTVRDLYGTMVHEGADYGWLLTTGAISRQARAWIDRKPIELWDGKMLAAQAKKYR